VVIEASGRVVAPGFMDIHTHCEGDFDKHPEAENFVRMGVTTVITGNCGSSYVNLGDSLTSVAARGVGINVGSLVGHGTVRRRVMGNSWRDPSTTEIAKMKDLVRKAMGEGAFGLSTGLIYVPNIYSKTSEIVELARVAGEAGGLYATHMRSEGTSIVEAINEALTVGREAKLPVEISHFKIVAPKLHGRSDMTVGMVEAARGRGQDVTIDQYVYTASSTGLGSMLPDWAAEGTTEVVQARLKDPATRKRIVDELVRERRDQQGRKDMSYAVVASFRPDPRLNGKNLVEVARILRGGDSWDNQIEGALDLITSGGAGMVYHSIDERDVKRIVTYPWNMFASDSGVREFGVGVPHPRGYGNNARVLARYVRELGMLKLEEAVRKMTSLPASRFGLADRGTLKPGMAADIVVFEPARVRDASTFEQPHAYSEGFDWVIVNGQPVIADGKMTGKLSGQVLRRPASGVGKLARSGK
jgi:N-acyl-D-amino-acid deacylase